MERKIANRIHYGFGKDYLKDWGIQEAFREILQNFLDFGEYEIQIKELGGLSKVTIINHWPVESLDFLRIGNSNKNNEDAIGKHGEGLKMAFLIFLREGYKSYINTQKHVVTPAFYIDQEIGECFCLEYQDNHLDFTGFEIGFECDSIEFEAFLSNVINKQDVIFTEHQWGSMVDKPKGNIYSGGLFVANMKGISASYDILPHRLPLDRDRRVPGSFDVSYATSRIKESYGKFTAEDLNHTDGMFIENIPEEVKKEFKPIKVGNSIEFQYKDSTGKDQILSNNSVKQNLHKDSFFEKAIKRIKNIIAKQLGLYDMLIEYQKKHVRSWMPEESRDFEQILIKAGKQEKIKYKPSKTEISPL